jgi:hypothetical protein
MIGRPGCYEIPSGAIACLWWVRAAKPEGWRAWWAILARTWR